MNIQTTAIRAIEAQQGAVPARSAQWMVGEQLKDICRREPKSAELIAQDLENEGMGIVEAEKKIKAFADKHREKNARSSCVTPVEAEDILRAFYGLPEPRVGEAHPQGSERAAQATGAVPPEPGPAPEATVPPSSGIIDLTDFL